MSTNVDFVLTYAKRDRADILDQIRVQLPAVSNGAWTNFTNNDIGTAVVKACVAAVDLGNFWIDNSVMETFLSTCALRESAVRRAKELNYIPGRMSPAVVQTLFTFAAFSSNQLLPALSLWRINGLTFVLTEAVEILAGQTQAVLSLTQGTPYSVTFTGDGTSFYTFTLPVDAANIEISVNSVVWTPVDSFVSLPIDDNGNVIPTVYKIAEDKNGQIIEFGGDNISTNSPGTSDTVSVSAVRTAGTVGNFPTVGISCVPISILRDQAGNDMTSIFKGITTTACEGGINLESIESIKQNAPAFHATGGRAVTKADYDAFMAKMIPGLTDWQVIPGETVGKKGKVIIVAYSGDPSTTTPEFLATIPAILKQFNILTVGIIMQAPTVVRCQDIIEVGLDPLVYNDLSTPTNLVVSAVQAYYSSLRIGGARYDSGVDTAAKNVVGIKYVNRKLTCTAAAISTAGKLAIAVPINIDPTSVLLTKADSTGAFSGDATSMITNNTFQYVQAGLTDQLMTLTFNCLQNNVLVQNGQVAFENNLQVNPLFLS